MIGEKITLAVMELKMTSTSMLIITRGRACCCDIHAIIA
jgi:hypothetical protein